MKHSSSPVLGEGSALVKPPKQGLAAYVAIARPNYWLRNLFLVPGALVAAVIARANPGELFVPLLLALVSACLIASANYTINEWLDAEFDRFHPVKQYRPAIAGNLKAPLVYGQYLLLLLAGLGLAALLSPYFLLATASLAVMGFLYNVKPFRTKERVYLDVLSESINNPIRLLMGWFVVTSAVLPPVSLLVGYWMVGAFLMTIKRYAELRFIADKERAGLYRRSFRFYSEQTLLTSAILYGTCAAGLLSAFAAGFHPALLLSLPLWSLLLAWYVFIGMKPDSPTQHPENLIRERGFTAYLLLLLLATPLLLLVDLPWLR
ncbi:MAG: UbiA family prenyltransferase [Chloroflexaceae bacterium]|nr:UbiA family prenyltransferase [Chloroflexaceae bacterium]